ncbi:MAG: ABC transporter permease [Sarcina sp.]
MNFRKIFQGLKRQKVFFICAVLQITIGFFAIYNSEILKGYVIQEKEQISKDLNNGEVYKLNLSEFDNETEDFMRKLNNSFNELENMTGVNVFYTSISDIYIKDKLNREILAPIIYLNENTLEKNTLLLSDGNILVEKIFNSKSGYENVILGSDFKETISVGDIISEDDKPKRVVGFLDEEQKLLTKIEYDNLRYDSLDNVILSMEFPGDISNYMKMSDNYLWFDNNISYKIQNDIVHKFEKIGLEANIVSISKYANKKIIEYKRNLNLSKFTSIITIIIITLTIIISLLNAIFKRKKEFGIYILLGATKNRLLKMLYFEILSIVLSGVIIVGVLVLLIYKSININIFMYILILAFIYSLIIMIIPIYKLKKISIKEFLKEV